MTNEEARAKLFDLIGPKGASFHEIRQHVFMGDWNIEPVPLRSRAIPELRSTLEELSFSVTSRELEALYRVTEAERDELQDRFLCECASELLDIFEDSLEPEGYLTCQSDLSDLAGYARATRARFGFLERAKVIAEQVCGGASYGQTGGTKSLKGIFDYASLRGIDVSERPNQTVAEFFAAHEIPISPDELVRLFDRKDNEYSALLEAAIWGHCVVKREGLSPGMTVRQSIEARLRASEFPELIGPSGSVSTAAEVANWKKGGRPAKKKPSS